MEEWDVIYRYTRANAIADGVLVDVSDTAREAGFVIPVAVTAGVWVEWIVPKERTHGQNESGRLWDVLNALRAEIKRLPEATTEVEFRVLFDETVRGRTATFRSVCGPGDDAEPVITIMLPGED